MSLARRIRRGSQYKKPQATKKNTTYGRRYSTQTIVLKKAASYAGEKLTKTIVHDITKK